MGMEHLFLLPIKIAESLAFPLNMTLVYIIILQLVFILPGVVPYIWVYLLLWLVNLRVTLEHASMPPMLLHNITLCSLFMFPSHFYVISLRVQGKPQPMLAMYNPEWYFCVSHSYHSCTSSSHEFIHSHHLLVCSVSIDGEYIKALL